jgi:signal peptidase I
MLKIDARSLAIVVLAILLAASLGAMPVSTGQDNTDNIALQLGMKNLTNLFRGYVALVAPAVDTSYISGTSMVPALHSGDLLLWVQYPYENLRVGDIIIFTLYTKPDMPTLSHRIIQKVPEGYLTQGDANPDFDKAALRENDIHGLVIGTVFLSSGSWHP